MVYIVQEVPGRDVLGAAKFGDLKLMLPPGDVVLSTEPTVHRLRKALQNFTDNDHLLLMGDPVAIGIATAIASEINQGVVKMLKWDRRRFSYYEVVIDLHGRLKQQTPPAKVQAIR